ncbi:Lrp/AsnC family transcriptional regulator [Mucilaginibacter oryzae]|uniref:Lrp/AsnC family transcriptional regulator n=1 Tax=Mucilaginibacter oryzae TaxID=468058 RepID=UPI000D6B13A9|nr:Lrp/AsnC ligand binding domain-containing protein [Mucilaginibacter oryzae]
MFAKLKATGVVRQFTDILDCEKIGQPVLVITHIKLEKQNTELLAEIESAMQALAQIQFCLHVSGNWNFFLQITATTPQAYLSS